MTVTDERPQRAELVLDPPLDGGVLPFVHNLDSEVVVTAYGPDGATVGLMAVLEISDGEVEVWLAGGREVARLVAVPAEE